MTRIPVSLTQEQPVNASDTHMERVEQLREQIGDTDREIVAQLARRLELVRRLGHEKARCGLATSDPAREAAVLRAAAAAARDAGLDPERVRELFWCVIGMSRAEQLRDRSS